MIETRDLTRRFGMTIAVDSVTLSIDDGEVFGLLGPNGAGKTTTLRMLAGLIGITSGQARVDGFDVSDPRDVVHVRERLGVLPEESGLYPDLTAYETLDFFARLHHVRDRRQRIDSLLERLSLIDRRDVPTAHLSKGLKQRLAIARALVNEPRIVFLDEPTANLDPEASREVRDLVLELKGRGCTVIINTHRLDEAERVCDRVGILRTRLLHVARPGVAPSSAEGLRVRLGTVTPEMIEAAQRAAGRQPTIDGHLLRLPGLDADQVPRVITALVGAGAEIYAIEQEPASLESLYVEVMADAR